ncbi:hypothetical protein KKF11_03230, partial [Patescibacteria group bacterium]|nr:hypothetical protein [Patescibacteria group bacterium]
PEAMINFLAHMGWSHPEGKEVFPLSEFVNNFSFKRVSTSAPIFDLEKLSWLNGVYIREKKDEELALALVSFAPKKMDKKLILKTVPLIKTRITKLSEYGELVDFLVEDITVDKNLLFKKSEKKEILKKQFEAVILELEKLKNWQTSTIEKALRFLPEKNKWKIGKYFMAIRIAVTGETITPPLFESISLLGKQKTILRLKNVLKFF